MPLRGRKLTATLNKIRTISIKSIALHHVRVPLVEPFRISNGVISEKDAILVEVNTGNDVIGWGEASPMSGGFYSSDTPESAWSVLSDSLIPAALNAGEIDVSGFYEQLRAHPGDAFAKAGIEGALWDAYANTLQVPFGELFGARPRPIPSGVAIGITITLTNCLKEWPGTPQRVIDASRSRFSRAGTLSRWLLCARDFRTCR